MSKTLRILAVVVVVCASLLTAAPAQAQVGNTWFLDFFANLNWAGAPTGSFSTTAPLAFNWGLGAPLPNMPVDNWTMRATTDVWMNAGTYNFTLQADDEVALIVNGVSFLDSRGQGLSGRTLNVQVPIFNSGFQRITVEFREFTQLAYVFMNWSLVGSVPPTVSPGPPTTMTPITGASSVVTRFGDYTPCIAGGNHQKVCFQSDGAWDSPNFGSIEMEPPITQWGNCTADQVQTRQLFVERAPQQAKCSKTEAGWFAM
jgi:hypothetical protein